MYIGGRAASPSFKMDIRASTLILVPNLKIKFTSAPKVPKSNANYQPRPPIKEDNVPEKANTKSRYHRGGV